MCCKVLLCSVQFSVFCTELMCAVQCYGVLYIVGVCNRLLLCAVKCCCVLLNIAVFLQCISVLYSFLCAVDCYYFL